MDKGLHFWMAETAFLSFYQKALMDKKLRRMQLNDIKQQQCQ